MDETEIRNHLRSIPLVNGHLLAQKESAQRKRARWVIGSSLLCVLGITTMVLGIGTMGNPIVIYDYGSEEIVPNGDNGGTRTFELYNTRSEIRSEWQWINVSGAFLLALGIFGFVIERKLYPKSS